jgi:Leucine-rich repeat (LRR) protein
MKQILLMMAAVVLVGCGEKAAPLPAAHTPENEPEIPQTDQAAEARAVVVNIADPIIEEAARLLSGKDEGELTAADVEKQDILLLYGKKITTTGLKELIKFPNLKNLDLSDTQITDEGIKELAILPKLTWLKLGYSKITDANLKEVAKLHNLKVLELRHTQITEEGKAELRKALPKCSISGP